MRTEPAEAALVAEMFDWYLRDGRTMLGLVRHLHDLGVRSPTGKEYWGQATVRGILANPTYTGQIYANRTRLRPARIRRSSTHPIGRPRDSQVPLPPEDWIPIATIPAIITREQFHRARARMAANVRLAARNNTVASYLLRALVSCGACGLACQARQVASGPQYYICTGKSPQVRQRTGAYCHSRFIPGGAIDGLVWADLVELLRCPEQIAAALRRAAGGCWLPQELRARQENLRRGRVSLAGQIERLTEAYLSGVVPLPEYQRRRAEFERRDAALSAQQEQLAGETGRVHEVAGLMSSAESFARRVSAGLAGATFEQKRQLVELLVDRVVVTGDAVEIRYVIPVGPAGEYGRFCHLRLDYLRGPGHVRPGRVDVAAQQVLGPRQAVVRVGRAGESLRSSRPDAAFSHELGHRVLRALVPPGVQLGGHPGAAVPTLHLGMHVLDHTRQLLPPVLGRAVGPGRPGVVPAGRHLQGVAHPPDRPLAGVRGDEPERQLGGLAK